MVRAMCGVQLNDRERSKDLMLGLNELLVTWLRQIVFICMVMC